MSVFHICICMYMKDLYMMYVFGGRNDMLLNVEATRGGRPASLGVYVCVRAYVRACVYACIRLAKCHADTLWLSTVF